MRRTEVKHKHHTHKAGMHTEGKEDKRARRTNSTITLFLQKSKSKRKLLSIIWVIPLRFQACLQDKVCHRECHTITCIKYLYSDWDQHKREWSNSPEVE